MKMVMMMMLLLLLLLLKLFARIVGWTKWHAVVVAAVVAVDVTKKWVCLEQDQKTHRAGKLAGKW